MGGYHGYKGDSRNFVDDLKGKSSDLVRRLGMIGYIAKGLAIAGAGVLVIVAAGRSEPNKATGVDGTLKTLGAQPYGAALLIAAGLGIVAYGLYSFAMARYTKMLMSLRFSPDGYTRELDGIPQIGRWQITERFSAGTMVSSRNTLGQVPCTGQAGAA